MRSLFSKINIIIMLLFLPLSASSNDVIQSSTLPKNASEENKANTQNVTSAIYLSTSIKNTTFLSDNFNVKFKNDSYVSFAVGLKAQNVYNRGLFFVGYEKFGEIYDQSNKDNVFKLGHLFFHVAYDRYVNVFSHKLFFTIGGIYIPIQGQPYYLNNVSLSPDPGLGYEMGFGLNAPYNFSFILGYRAVFRQFEYYGTSGIAGATERNTHAAGYTGLFITTCLGRF